MSRVAVLGGGPAGLGAAYRLRSEDRAEVVLFERGPVFGGNAASLTWNGHRLDLGSHRLHPSCDGEVLGDIRSLLGDGLLLRPRHGRIRLLDRWVHFPLRPLNLLRRARAGFVLGVAGDSLAKLLPKRPASGGGENFSSVIESGLGRTIHRHFYEPYARKIWGRDPRTLSAIQARRRVSAGSLGKLATRILAQLPGLRKPMTGRFFYPREGFGRISDAYAQAAAGGGADLRPRHTVEEVRREPGGRFRVRARTGESIVWEEADLVWSTLPLSVLVETLRPAPPEPVLRAARAIRTRGMVLVYLELDTDRFSEYDAHYFPSPEVRITRLSEPKVYAAREEPRGRTVLCAELPCDAGDEDWRRDDAELQALVLEDLARSGLAPSVPVLDRKVLRLPSAYPIYLEGYERHVARIDDFLASVPGLLSFGRQGLFAHDNTHHALYMAYAAARCLRADGFDRDRWAGYRRIFETHVVED